jgi:hypothetical protein
MEETSSPHEINGVEKNVSVNLLKVLLELSMVRLNDYPSTVAKFVKNFLKRMEIGLNVQ